MQVVEVHKTRGFVTGEVASDIFTFVHELIGQRQVRFFKNKESETQKGMKQKLSFFERCSVPANKKR